MTNVAITRERPDMADAAALIRDLEAVLSPLYAVESRHGYSVDKLIREGVHFFVARADGKPAACGGIQFYPGFGELKRMFVRDPWRGRGLGHAMLEHLTQHARANGCGLLRLETGIHQHEAIKLYERWGFARIGAFAPYKPDPVSIFYEKRL
jgi:GNAT superfamily N-acetyltransferase